MMNMDNKINDVKKKMTREDCILSDLSVQKDMIVLRGRLDGLLIKNVYPDLKENEDNYF